MIWMILLILVAGGLAALFGAGRGVFFMAAMLFNMLIAVYLSVLSAPLVLQTSPVVRTSGYYSAFCLLLLVAAVFLLLEGIVYYLLLRNADVLLPVWFDRIGGAVLGFLTSWVAIGVLALVVCMMPFSRLEFFEEIIPREALQKTASGTLTRSFGFIACWSLECLEDVPQETLTELYAYGDNAAIQSGSENPEAGLPVSEPDGILQDPNSSG